MVEAFRIRGNESDQRVVATALSRARDAGYGEVVFSRAAYNIEDYLDVPENVSLRGVGTHGVVLRHAFNGDMIRLRQGTGLFDLTLHGQGGTYRGRGVVFSGSDGKQTVQNARIIEFDGPCVDFESTLAGSQCSFHNCEIYRINGASGSGRYALTMARGEQLAAVPRKFTQIETSGQCAFDFGGCSNVYVTNSTIADVAYTPNSRGVHILATRLLNQAALTVRGHGNSILGGAISPRITLAPGTDACTIGPASFNILPIIDNSGNHRNNITHWAIDYAPVMSTGGAAPSLGNGTLTGTYSREGALITATINLQLGTTTRLGTGDLRFSLPVARRAAHVEVGGSAIINHTGTIYTAAVQIPGGAGYLAMVRDGSGSVTGSSPGLLRAGDTIRVTTSYHL